MRSFRVLLLATITILLSGCPARSFHPLFTDKDAIFNEALIGTWANKDEMYTFEKLQENNYRSVTRPRDESDSAVYAVWSGKIGSVWFLDSYPIVNSKEHHFLSVHVFTRMTIRGDTLALASFEADWLLKMINEKKIKIAHVQRENEIILTASTSELQHFFSTIATNNEAFPNENVYVRSK